MALRSQIGSSLVAKATPASPIRKTQEQTAMNPAIPGKGEVGTINRNSIQEPFLKPVPAGSARTVSVTPNAEAGAISSPTNKLADESAGMVPNAANNSASSTPLRSGANSQALFQGGVSNATAASTPSRGVTAKSVSTSGANKGAINPSGRVSEEGAASTYQAPEFRTASTQLPLVKELGGGVIAAENPKKTVTGTTGQQIAGTIGKAITAIGTALKAPQLTPGGAGAKLQTFGGSSAVAQQGIGSASNALRSVVQTVSNALNKLRSLFK